MTSPPAPAQDTLALFPLVVASSVAATAGFYRQVVGLEMVADLGWYVQLADAEHPWRQLGVIAADHDSLPPGHRVPGRILVTAEVGRPTDVDEIHSRARGLGGIVELPPRDEPWGQRHVMLLDPDGVLVDVVASLGPAGAAEPQADPTDP